ncbi:unnamed protein product [Oikopleura dioica]|uniref:Uncharacterized protein n=1 Tax=Oikopleura dioica TaxID=34765 RepID=E4XAT3_OIKDI|nr:unnamed protein product [Oikopleura dioica]
MANLRIPLWSAKLWICRLCSAEKTLKSRSMKRIKPVSTQEERQRLIRQWSKGKLLKLSSLLTEAARKSFGNAPRLDAINCKRLALFGQVSIQSPRRSHGNLVKKPSSVVPAQSRLKDDVFFHVTSSIYSAVIVASD